MLGSYPIAGTPLAVGPNANPTVTSQSIALTLSSVSIVITANPSVTSQTLSLTENDAVCTAGAGVTLGSGMDFGNGLFSVFNNVEFHPYGVQKLGRDELVGFVVVLGGTKPSFSAVVRTAAWRSGVRFLYSLSPIDFAILS